jgi:hypothetical protein
VRVNLGIIAKFSQILIVVAEQYFRLVVSCHPENMSEQ